MNQLDRKYTGLCKFLNNIPSAIIAYSGGVDSTFLVHVMHNILHKKVIVCTAISDTYPNDDMEVVKQFTKKYNINQIFIKTDELSNPDFVSNPPERCYFCKKELYSKLHELAKKYRVEHILDGTNFDDTYDHRPGMKAAVESGVISPLKEAGLTKSDIRSLSRKFGLPTWNKPASPCIASRFPYGIPINEDKLVKVKKAEEFLKSIGFNEVRLRHHNDIARIEVQKDKIPELIKYKDKIVANLKQLGYLYITIDLEGYRQGSLNEVLK